MTITLFRYVAWSLVCFYVRCSVVMRDSLHQGRWHQRYDLSRDRLLLPACQLIGLGQRLLDRASELRGSHSSRRAGINSRHCFDLLTATAKAFQLLWVKAVELP